jgi:imidazolonepropionase-like amidohydrolase
MKYRETHFVRNYPPDSGAIVELRNGRLVDVTNGCFFDPTVRVMIKGTTIKALPGIEGEPTDVTPDYTIDLQGKTAMPGLFNTHCHLMWAGHSPLATLRDVWLGRRYSAKQIERSLAECLIHGITNIRDAMTENLGVNKALRSRISKGEMPGPRVLQAVAVVPSGSYIATGTTFIPRFVRRLFGWQATDYRDSEAGVLEFPTDADDTQVREAVDRAIAERGAEAIKVGEERRHLLTHRPLTLMTMRQFRALVDQARRRGLQTMMHCTSVDSFRRGVEAGVSSLSHIPADAVITAQDAETFVEAKCIIEPTLSVAYSGSWRIANAPTRNHPDLVRLSDFRSKHTTFASIAEEYFVPELRDSILGVYERYSTSDFRVMGIIDATKTFTRVASFVADGIANVRKLYSAGAAIALGNDGGAAPPCTPAMMGLELALLHLFLNQGPNGTRFSSADALKVATINSARSVGLQDSFGTLESGKTADIVIVDGNPFEDYQVVSSRVAALFMDGRMVINNCGLEVEPVRKP